MNPALKELVDNSHDIGCVSGVLRGIELTPTLIPNQKDAIAEARKAIDRIEKRNIESVEAFHAGKLDGINEVKEIVRCHADIFNVELVKEIESMDATDESKGSISWWMWIN